MDEYITLSQASKILNIQRSAILKVIEREHVELFKRPVGVGRGRIPRLVRRSDIEKLASEIRPVVRD